jgi:hypothetical protein
VDGERLELLWGVGLEALMITGLELLWGVGLEALMITGLVRREVGIDSEGYGGRGRGEETDFSPSWPSTGRAS